MEPETHEKNELVKQEEKPKGIIPRVLFNLFGYKHIDKNNMLIALQQERINDLTFQLEDFKGVRAENNRLKEEIYSLRSKTKNMIQDVKPVRKEKLTGVLLDVHTLLKESNPKNAKAALKLYLKKYKDRKHTTQLNMNSYISKIKKIDPNLKYFKK